MHQICVVFVRECCCFKGGAVLQWLRVLCSLRAGERVGQSRVARAPGAPCLCRLSQESFRVSSMILCFLFSPPSLCCLSQAVLWSMIRFQLQAAAVSLVGAGFKAFLSLVLHQKNKTSQTHTFVFCILCKATIENVAIVNTQSHLFSVICCICPLCEPGAVCDWFRGFFAVSMGWRKFMASARWKWLETPNGLVQFLMEVG